MNLRPSEEAVSPVIGVILMVAIAVLMGGVIWYLVGPLSDSNVPDTRLVGFSVDSTGPGGTLTVVHVGDQVLQWSQVSMSAASTATCTVPPSGQINAGDEVTCTTEGSLTLIHTTSSDSVIIFSGEIK